MPSDAFIGILTGLGAAHRERQKNIFDQEVERRGKYEQFLQKASTDPNYRPEAQEQFANLYTTLIQTPYEKKLPKDFERQISDAVTSVEGSSNLSQGGPPQSEQVGDAITGKRVETPEPPPFQGKMPARFSAEEKFAEAMRLLNAQLQARSGSEIETERQKLAMQPDEAFPFGAESGLATRSGKVLREPQLQPEQPPLDKEVDTFTGADGYRVTTYQRPDGSTYERKSTSKVQPLQTRPSNPNLDRLRELDIENKTIASPGQVVFKSSGRPVGQQMPEAAAVRLEGLQTAIEQADVVEKALLNLGNTGAIKGFIEENGVYWPVVQDSLTPAQAEAVAETNRLLSAYAQAVSGLAVSEQEIGRLKRSAPNVKLTPEANKKIIGHFRRNAQTKLRNYLDLRGWKLSGIDVAAPAPPPTPAVGSEQNGWIFLGGDPSNPASWRKK